MSKSDNVGGSRETDFAAELKRIMLTWKSKNYKADQIIIIILIKIINKILIKIIISLINIVLKDGRNFP